MMREGHLRETEGNRGEREVEHVEARERGAKLGHHNGRAVPLSFIDVQLQRNYCQ